MNKNIFIFLSIFLITIFSVNALINNIYYDDFESGSAINWTLPTGTVSNSASLNGTYSIYTGLYSGGSGDTHFMNISDLSNKNFTLQTMYKHEDGSNGHAFGIGKLMTTTSGTTIIFCRTEGGGGLKCQNSTTSGTESTISSSGFGTDTIHTFKFVIRDSLNKYDLYVDGILNASDLTMATHTNLSNTALYLQMWNTNARTKIDNVEIYEILADIKQYNITNTQDMTELNLTKLNLTIDSKVTSTGSISSNTSMLLFSSINTTLNNGCAIFEQSTCVQYGTYVNTSMTSINNSHFRKTLYDNSLFPAYYPFNFNYIDSTPHLNYTAYSGNNIRFKIFNFSNAINYTINLEFDAINKSSVLSALFIYYCNASYVNGNPSLRPESCELVDSFTSDVYNHIHNNSKHQVIPLYIRNISKTQNSSIIFIANSNALNGWNFGYVLNSSYNNRSFEEGNFNAFSLGSTATNKIFDIHLHPVNIQNDKFNYYTQFNDNGTITTSSVKTLFYNQTYSKPIGVEFLLPNCSDQFTLGSARDIIIDWTDSATFNKRDFGYDLFYDNGLTTNDIYNSAVESLPQSNYTWISADWNTILYPSDWWFNVDISDGQGQEISTMECTINICQNDYQPVTTPCVDNLRHLYYTDVNTCNEQLGVFPVDNDTYTDCVSPSTAVTIDDDLLLIIILLGLAVVFCILGGFVHSAFFGLASLMLGLLLTFFIYNNYDTILIVAMVMCILVFSALGVILYKIRK